MQRKLVKQGAATLMVSLPAKWAQKNNLDKGDVVDLIEKNNSLIITSETIETKKSVELNITKFNESSIRASLATLYRLGYDKFKINFSDKKALEIIEDVLDRNLVGFEIIRKEQHFKKSFRHSFYWSFCPVLWCSMPRMARPCSTKNVLPVMPLTSSLSVRH